MSFNPDNWYSGSTFLRQSFDYVLSSLTPSCCSTQALLELVLRCQSALALSFDHCVRLYRKLLARLEVRPTGFGAGKDSAPGHGPLQMELAAFLMHRGEVERAYDAVKP